MKRLIFPILLAILTGFASYLILPETKNEVLSPVLGETATSVVNEFTDSGYWFLLHRKSNVEFLYFGVSGDKEKSELKKTFKVKTGIPGRRPTPLPALVGREYWVITSKKDASDNPDTAPYFLTLDIPFTDEEHHGPVPYNECSGKQCNWVTPGAFGLHGVGGDQSKLSPDHPGSSGCIRHTDSDITYLYQILDPQNEEIRYYIEDL